MRRPDLALALTFALSACGGGHTEQTTASASPPPAQASGEEEHTGGIMIEGQMGFLSEEQLSDVLRPATQQFASCYNDRVAENSYLAGRIELKFHIGSDGSPTWVIPTSSTIGDRPTEECIVQHAMSLHFPRPRGGETETTYPLEFAGGDDARPATEWPSSRIEHALNQHRNALTQCTHGHQGPFVVTLYASPHGTVATAGVSVPNADSAQAIDCIVHEVTSWHVPTPGSWYARTTITLP